MPITIASACPRLQSTEKELHLARGKEGMRHRQSNPLGLRWIQRGPAQHGRGKSGTRVWPAAGTQAAGRGPRWLRRRGGQPGLTGAGSTGGWRGTSYPGTGQREERAGQGGALPSPRPPPTSSFRAKSQGPGGIASWRASSLPMEVPKEATFIGLLAFAQAPAFTCWAPTHPSKPGLNSTPGNHPLPLLP